MMNHWKFPHPHAKFWNCTVYLPSLTESWKSNSVIACDLGPSHEFELFSSSSPSAAVRSPPRPSFARVTSVAVAHQGLLSTADADYCNGSGYVGAGEWWWVPLGIINLSPYSLWSYPASWATFCFTIIVAVSVYISPSWSFELATKSWLVSSR